MSQSELLIPFRFTIDQSAHTEPLRESFELTERRCSLGKIDEVGLHTSFSEEPECLTSVGVFFDPEDLYFHGAAEASVIPDAMTVSAHPRATGNLRQW
jgi:hypothetical protein